MVTTLEGDEALSQLGQEKGREDKQREEACSDWTMIREVRPTRESDARGLRPMIEQAGVKHKPECSNRAQWVSSHGGRETFIIIIIPSFSSPQRPHVNLPP